MIFGMTLVQHTIACKFTKNCEISLLFIIFLLISAEICSPCTKGVANISAFSGVLRMQDPCLLTICLAHIPNYGCWWHVIVRGMLRQVDSCPCHKASFGHASLCHWNLLDGRYRSKTVHTGITVSFFHCSPRCFLVDSLLQTSANVPFKSLFWNESKEGFSKSACLGWRTFTSMEAEAVTGIVGK